MQITREDIFQKCEELGEEEVRNKSPHWTLRKRKFADEWLSIQDSKRDEARFSRSEAREEESLTISRRALVASERANELAAKANSIASKARSAAKCSRRIAISAIVFSTITAIIVAIIQFMANKPPGSP